MKYFGRYVMLGLLVAVLGVLVVPAMAQEGQGFGEGGVVFIGNTAGDPATFNPLLGDDATSSDIYDQFTPGLFGVDYETGTYLPGAPGSLATAWEFDETGTLLTVHMREDAFWSDGVQITANDYVWGMDALKSGLLDTPRGVGMFEVLDDGTPGSGSVTEVVALDDFTVQITFARPNCAALNEVFGAVVPSHIYEADWGDDLAAMNEEPRYDPGVYFGAFIEPELIAGDRVNLVANPDYADGQLGFVSPSEWVYLNLPDGDVALERFRAGDLTIFGIPGPQQAEFEADPNFQTFRWIRRGYVFFGFNHANPANPMPAYDEEGNLQEQDPHPILGDKLVRQAIVMAVDMDALIEGGLGGQAVRVGTPTIPSGWDWNPDLLYPFDPIRAAELLDEAGWVMEDGEFRVCRGCAYTEIDPNFEGTELAIKLNDSGGSTAEFEAAEQFMIQQMRDVGVNAELNILDWGSAFLPALTGQTFDMAILAWSLSLPLEPHDGVGIFGSEADIPVDGFNFGSYVNTEVDQLYLDAVNPSLTDGCSVEGRLAIYSQINEILFDELPYMFMYANLRLTAAQGWVENWQPLPFSTTWQEDAWIAIAPAN